MSVLGTANPYSGSMLAKIRAQLEQNKTVYTSPNIVAITPFVGWLEQVDILVGPIQPISNLEAFNKYVKSLIPGFQSPSTDQARETPQGNWGIPYLHTDEILGKQTNTTNRVIEEVEPGALSRLGIVTGEIRDIVSTDYYKRLIAIYVYPSALLAEMAYRSRIDQDYYREVLTRNPDFNDKWIPCSLIAQ